MTRAIRYQYKTYQQVPELFCGILPCSENEWEECKPFIPGTMAAQWFACSGPKFAKGFNFALIYGQPGLCPIGGYSIAVRSDLDNGGVLIRFVHGNPVDSFAKRLREKMTPRPKLSVVP